MARFDDYDPGPTHPEVGGLGPALQVLVSEEEARTVAVAALLMEAVEALEQAPFHAYAEWRERGKSVHARTVSDWQEMRDDVVNRAHRLTGGIV
jgi:hypothetical protein